MYKAKFYQKNKNNSVKCRLCNHFCVINKNKTGICRVRKNKDGELYSLVYGHPAAQNIDPIEKKPLFHFLPGSNTYSLGTLGCNFQCTNCQNWDISQKNPKIKKISEDLCSPEKIVAEAINNDCKSISYTYNEPTIFTEYALDIMKKARESGLKNIWVSNGFMSDECLEEILPFLDAINTDLKSFNKKFYKENCNGKLEPILKNIKKIKRETHLEISTLIIPDLSDDISMLEELTDFIASDLDPDTPWHISKFFPKLSWKTKKTPPTGDDVIYSAYEIGKDAGLKYVYVGNMPGDQKENTYCPRCGELAIRRFGYQIERLDNSGRCPACDNILDIIE